MTLHPVPPRPTREPARAPGAVAPGIAQRRRRASTPPRCWSPPAAARPSRLPVWFMRQAGRSLPEYRALRAGTGMLQACLTPELACEITLQPVRRHGVDAAILFSDIVVPLHAAGVGVDIVPGTGPVVAEPVRTAGRRATALPAAARRAGRPGRRGDRAAAGRAGRHPADRLRRRAVHAGVLPGRGRAEPQPRAHQGADAPGPRRVARADGPARRRSPPTFLRAQVAAGVDAVQLFDSWAGALSERDYREYVLPHSARVLGGLADAGVPRIHFGVGTGELLGAMAEAGADVVGVDWRVPLDEAARRAGGRRAGAGQPRPGRAVRRPRRRSPPRCGASSARAARARGTCSTSATACSRTPTRTCSPGSSSWCTAWTRSRGRTWTSRPRPIRVAVVGAGISGLAAAHRLRVLLGPAAEITVLEQRDRLGGVLRTVELAGVPYDVGAEAFLARRPEVAALLAELGLADARVHPTAAAPSVRAGGPDRAAARRHPARRADRAEPGWTGCCPRPAPPRSPPSRSGRCAGRRVPTSRSGSCCGPASATSWSTGWSTRCSAGCTRAGSTRSACGPRCPPWPPRWTPAPRSLTAGADAALGRVAGSGRAGVRGAARRLPGAAGRLGRRGATSAAGQHGPRAAPDARGAGGSTSARPPDPEPLDVDAVLLAVPAPAAARLLAGVAGGGRRGRRGDRARLLGRRRAGLPRRDAATLPPTSGVLVAAGEPLAVKGVTHSSTKWAHLSPDGLVRLRASLGRFGEAADAAGRRRRAGRQGAGRPGRAGRDHRRAGRRARAALGRRAAPVRARPPRPGAPRSSTACPTGWPSPGPRCTASACRPASAPRGPPRIGWSGSSPAGRGRRPAPTGWQHGGMARLDYAELNSTIRYTMWSVFRVEPGRLGEDRTEVGARRPPSSWTRWTARAWSSAACTTSPACAPTPTTWSGGTPRTSRRCRPPTPDLRRDTVARPGQRAGVEPGGAAPARPSSTRATSRRSWPARSPSATCACTRSCARWTGTCCPTRSAGRCSPTTARRPAATPTCGPTRCPRSRSATTSGSSPSRPTSWTGSST